MKDKGERVRYTQLNAEFQTIASRDKKASFNEQCKEIEENIRMRKNRDLFKKIGDIKGIFHDKWGMIKDRNDMYLTKAEDIKKRWQKYTEELYTRNLNDLTKHNDVVTHLEPDFLECEGKWALRNITKNTSSFPVWIPFTSFSALTAVANTSNTMLKSSGESGHPCLIPDFRGNAFNFSPLRVRLAVDLSYSFYYIEVCSFYSYFLESFNHK